MVFNFKTFSRLSPSFSSGVSHRNLRRAAGAHPHAAAAHGQTGRQAAAVEDAAGAHHLHGSPREGRHLAAHGVHHLGQQDAGGGVASCRCG